MIAESKGILRIGTSGIVVPGNKQSLPSEFHLKSRLNYYASLFNTVEVNSTFKKLPRLSTLEKWSLDVQEEFRFTIKVWKEITHVKQLNFKQEKIATLLNLVNHIGNKKGCLLVQFPGSINAKYRGDVEQLLVQLHQLDHKNEWRKAIEFRSESWYSKQTYELVKQYNGTTVLHDMPNSKHLASNDPAAFAYFRFHGPKGDYRGSYSSEFLEDQAEKIHAILHTGKDVYAYFNNTMGNAFENAVSLKAMLEK